MACINCKKTNNSVPRSFGGTIVFGTGLINKALRVKYTTPRGHVIDLEGISTDGAGLATITLPAGVQAILEPTAIAGEHRFEFFDATSGERMTLTTPNGQSANCYQLEVNLSCEDQPASITLDLQPLEDCGCEACL